MRVKEIISATQWFPSKRHESKKTVVSVLLPTYRRGASGLFLKAARSVLNQSLSDIELIIVDDASTDGTADQIEQIMAEDDRVSLLRHPENVGLPAISEYEAFLKARSDYLAFAFDDDEFSPNALQDLLGYMVNNDFSVIHGHVDIQYLEQSNEKIVNVSGFGRGGENQSMLAATNYISNNAVLLHRRVIERVGFYDPHVAICRFCDWDLWRRLSQAFEIVAVDVSVGKVLGPSTRDSLGHTYPMEPWQVIEWMNLPRDKRLLPENFEEYDVLKIPDQLSRLTKVAIEEIRENFRNRFWFPKKTGTERYFYISPGRADETLNKDGYILVVTPFQDASISLYFNQLPQFFHQRVRFVYPEYHQPEEMIGANAVIFIRQLFYFLEWIGYARELKIPHYYFLDINQLLLREDPAFSNDYSFFTETNVRQELESFSGVLLSTPALLDFFKKNKLHDNLIYYPPVVHAPVLFEKIAPGFKREKSFRIAFLGESVYHQAFNETVFPAIEEFAREHSVKLFLSGIKDKSLQETPHISIYYSPNKTPFDLTLQRFTSWEVDVLVHPISLHANNPYGTWNLLVIALALNAVPIISKTPPYDSLEPERVCLLCEGDQNSWLDAFRIVSDQPETVRAVRQNLKLYCQKHFNGLANANALNNILQKEPPPGFVLRDMRYRKFIEALRHPIGRREDENQINENTGSFSIINPVETPKSHVWIHKKIEYQIKPTRDRWTGIEVVVGTHQRPAEGKLELLVFEKSGALLRETSVDLGKARDSDWLKFFFSPIPNSAFFPFILEFSLTDPGPRTLVSFFETRLQEGKFKRLIRRLGISNRRNALYCRTWYGT